MKQKIIKLLLEISKLASVILIPPFLILHCLNYFLDSLELKLLPTDFYSVWICAIFVLVLRFIATGLNKIEKGD